LKRQAILGRANDLEKISHLERIRDFEKISHLERMQIRKG